MASAKVRMTGLDRRPIEVERGAIDALAKSLRGKLLEPSSEGYAEACAIWNGMIARRPALIARCATPDDVVPCIQFARRHRVLLSIRGGGHNIAGNALCEGGLTIDLSALREVRIGEGNRVIAGPGATLADLDAATQQRGLAVPVGINSTTGIAGLVLGGGFGWLSRKYGLTADFLVGADVITATGDRVRASERENPDLFWALRGGGGNFGVVTSFEFEARPLGPEVYAGLAAYPISAARAAIDAYAEFSARAPDDLSVWMVLRRAAPPLPFLPTRMHGEPVLLFAVFWAGDPAAGDKAVAPLLAHAPPAGAALGRQPYLAWQQAFDPLLTPGARNYWKSHNFAGLGEPLREILIEHAIAAPTQSCEVFVGQLGGATARVPSTATAYAHRDVAYVMNVHGRWEDPADDARGKAWVRGLFDAAAPHATGGVYVNFMPDDETTARIGAAYGSNHARLAAIKARFDPENLFRVNQNIAPGPTPQPSRGAEMPRG